MSVPSLLRHAVAAGLLAAFVVAGSTSTALADSPLTGSVVSNASGDWSDPTTWPSDDGPGVPAVDATVTLMHGHAVALTADETVGSLTIDAGATLDLAGHTLTVDGPLELIGIDGDPSVITSGPGGAIDAECYQSGYATLTDVAVTITDADACSQTSVFGTGATTWTSSSFTQSSGSATLAGDAAGLSPTFTDAAVRVVPGASFGGTLTLDGTGGLTFLPNSGQDDTDPALLTVDDLTVSGTYPMSVGWWRLAPPVANGTRLNLIETTAGDTTALALDASPDATTDLARDAANARIFATYDAAPVTIGDTPSVSSNNAFDAAHAGAGDTLSCATGDWFNADSYGYAWTRDGTPIVGATGSTYLAKVADAGRTVRCVVTAIHGSKTTALTSASGIAVIAAPAPTVVPTLSSSSGKAQLARPDETLSCDAGTWPTPGTLTRAWRRDRTIVTGQTGATYLVTDADHGAAITCTVTYRSYGGATEATTDAFTVPAAPRATFADVPNPVTTRTLVIDYAVAAGSQVVACRLDGVTLDACPDGLTVGDYASGMNHTFSLVLTNAAGEQAIASLTFSAAFAPSVDVALSNEAAVGEDQRFTVTAGPGDRVSCTLGGRDVPCDPGSNSVRLTPADAAGRSTTTSLEYELRVTATNGAGTATAVRRWRSLFDVQRPTAAVMAAGTTGDYTWPVILSNPQSVYDTSAVKLQWAGGPAASGKKLMRVTAPSAPGTYTVAHRWSAAGDFIVYVYDPAAVVPRAAVPAGVTSATGSLVCPRGAEGTVYSWSVNGQPIGLSTATNELPASAVPKSGVVACQARDPQSGAISQLQALADPDGRVAALLVNGKIVVTSSAGMQLQIDILAAGAKRSATTTAQAQTYRKLERISTSVHAGRNTIRPKDKLGKGDYRIELRVLHVKRASGKAKPKVTRSAALIFG